MCAPELVNASRLCARASTCMTLVIGTAFGHFGGAILSDTRVTFASGEYRDMIRKAYPVGNYMAVGFAGSVAIGFRMVNDLAWKLRRRPERPNAVCLPFVVAEAWAQHAKAIYEQAHQPEQMLGSRILMVALDPQGSGVRLIRLDSPSFIPQFARQGLRTCSIGSGAKDRRYMRVVRPHADMRGTPAQFLQGGIGLWAGVLADAVGQESAQHPRKDVGRHFHVLTVEQAGFTLHTSGRKSFVDWQDEPIDLDPMPVVADDYLKFKEMAEAEGFASAAASC